MKERERETLYKCFSSNCVNLPKTKFETSRPDFPNGSWSEIVNWNIFALLQLLLCQPMLQANPQFSTMGSKKFSIFLQSLESSPSPDWSLHVISQWSNGVSIPGSFQVLDLVANLVLVLCCKMMECSWMFLEKGFLLILPYFDVAFVLICEKWWARNKIMEKI